VEQSAGRSPSKKVKNYGKKLSIRKEGKGRLERRSENYVENYFYQRAKTLEQVKTLTNDIREQRRGSFCLGTEQMGLKKRNLEEKRNREQIWTGIEPLCHKVPAGGGG